MKMQGIWIRCGILPYYLKGEKLALALLLREKPLSATQLADLLTAKGHPCDCAALEKSLAALARLGLVSVSDGVYTCTADLSRRAPAYSESQLLDLVGMTQSTLHAHAFYTTIPPMSSSSNNGNIL